MTSSSVSTPSKSSGVAGGQQRSVTDGDRGDHQVDAALAARRSASAGNQGAEFAVDIGFALGEGQPLAVDRTVPDEFDTGLGGTGRHAQRPR